MKIIYWLNCSIILICCTNDSITKVGNIGVVALNANLSAEDPLENYVNEYQTIYNLGAYGVQIAAPWNSVNPIGEQYDLTAVSNPFFGIKKLKEIGFQQVLLNVPIVAILQRKMPIDIATLPFDDPIVKERMHQMIDQLDSFLPSITYLSLGNEVDSYFKTHIDEWPAFIALTNDVKSYTKNKFPELQIGVTTTFDGYSTTQKDFVKTLNKDMDIIILTYYATTAGFMVKSPETVEADFDLMSAMSNNKSIILQEAGYPSSSVLGSSESMQERFVQNLINAWRKHGELKFPFISFFKYRDWSTAYVQQFTGQLTGQAFFEFMSSLGLLRHDYTTKPGMELLKIEIKK